MKKLIVMLAAALHFKKGATVEVEEKVADELIAAGKAVAVDPSVRLRDHASDDDEDDDDEGEEEDALSRVVAKAIKPIVKSVKALEQRLDDMPAAPRPAKTRNVGDVRADVAEPVEGEDGPGEVVTLGDVVAELRELRAEQGRAATVRRGFDYRGISPEDGTGLKLARYIRASVAAKNAGVSADVILDKWGHKAMGDLVRKAHARHLAGLGIEVSVEKGLNQSTFADGGALVPEQFSADMIPLLRNATVVRKAGARVIQLNGGNLTLPKQTSGSTATYVGETTVDTPSKPGLGALKFAEKKLRVGVVLSNDLIQNAALSADAWVRDDMVRQTSIKEDLQALFGVGSQYSPTGIESLLASTRKVDSTAVDRTAPTLAETRKDLSKIIRLVKQSNVISAISKLAWIMNARMEAFLGSITDGNGNAVYLQGLDNGTLRGYPVLVTEQVPDNLASFAAANADETRLFFGDFDTFVIAESGGGMQVKVFPDGTYEEGGTVKSGASRDETYVRLILKHDFNMRYDNTIVDSSHRPA